MLVYPPCMYCVQTQYLTEQWLALKFTTFDRQDGPVTTLPLALQLSWLYHTAHDRHVQPKFCNVVPSQTIDAIFQGNFTLKNLFWLERISFIANWKPVQRVCRRNKHPKLSTRTQLIIQHAYTHRHRHGKARQHMFVFWKILAANKLEQNAVFITVCFSLGSWV